MAEIQGHTPGPWRLIWWGNESSPCPLSIYAADDRSWITRDGSVSSEANARFIVRACNSHDAMVKALKAMLAVHDENERQGRIRFAKGSTVDLAAKAARAALSSAREG